MVGTLAVAAAGCGSGSTASSAPSAPDKSTPAPLASKAKQGIPRPVGPRLIDGRPLQRHSSPVVVREINTVCSTVLSGAPPALQPPFTKGKLVAQVNQGRPVTQRTIVSLTRLQTLGDSDALQSLVQQYAHLQTLYDTAQVLEQKGTALLSLGNQIVIQQQAIAATARRSKLPACAVPEL